MADLFARLQTPASFLFVLGVLIFIHELGHFLVARWYGIRVLTFSLGFGPKLLKVRRGDTEYCISAVPLGGYVKMAGETVQDDRAGAPDEFLSKSKWIRFQVYLAGPVMNLFLAWVVLGGVLVGDATVAAFPDQPAIIGSIASDSPAARAGMQVGDRIVRINDRETPTWERVRLVEMGRANRELTIVVERDGREIPLRVVPTAVGEFEMGSIGVGERQRPQVQQVFPGTAAETAGFRQGDVIVAVDGERGLDDTAVRKRILDHGAGEITFTIERDGQEMPITATLTGEPGRSQLGVNLSPFELRRVQLGFVEAFALSAQRNVENAKLIGEILRDIVTREQSMNQLGGPVMIGQLAGAAASFGWEPLFELIAGLSLNLALLNLLPIPVLDGGQMLILCIEGLFRRELSIRVKERMLIAGAALIVLLLVTVMYNDIARLLR